MTPQASGRKMSPAIISEHVFASWKIDGAHKYLSVVSSWCFYNQIFSDLVEEITFFSHLGLRRISPTSELETDINSNDWKLKNEWMPFYNKHVVKLGLKRDYLPTTCCLVTEYILSLYRISWPSLTPVYRVVGHYLWPMKWAFPTTIALMIAKAIASAKWV